MKLFEKTVVMGIAVLAGCVMFAPLSAWGDADHRHPRPQPHWQVHAQVHEHEHEHEHEHDGDHVRRFDRDAGRDHDRFRHFSDGDWDAWRHGHWVRGHDGDELGWWWVVAGIWYFYPHRTWYAYPYPPGTVVINQPATSPPADATNSPGTPAQDWYYCRESKAYYPYVKTCAGKWEKVPSTPPPPPPN